MIYSHVNDKWLRNLQRVVIAAMNECDSAAAIEGARLSSRQRENLRSRLRAVADYIEEISTVNKLKESEEPKKLINPELVPLLALNMKKDKNVEKTEKEDKDNALKTIFNLNKRMEDL